MFNPKCKDCCHSLVQYIKEGKHPCFVSHKETNSVVIKREALLAIALMAECWMNEQEFTDSYYDGVFSRWVQELLK